MTECIERIERFIKKSGYTYNVGDIIEGYRRYYKPGWYCSYTMNICINNNINDIKFIDKYLKKRNK